MARPVLQYAAGDYAGLTAGATWMGEALRRSLLTHGLKGSWGRLCQDLALTQDLANPVFAVSVAIRCDRGQLAPILRNIDGRIITRQRGAPILLDAADRVVQTSGAVDDG